MKIMIKFIQGLLLIVLAHNVYAMKPHVSNYPVLRTVNNASPFLVKVILPFLTTTLPGNKSETDRKVNLNYSFRSADSSVKIQLFSPWKPEIKIVYEMRAKNGGVTVNQLRPDYAPGEWVVERSFDINEPVFDVEINVFMSLSVSGKTL